MQKPTPPNPTLRSQREGRDLFTEFLVDLHRNSVCTEELVEKIRHCIERYGVCEDSAASSCRVSAKDFARWKQERQDLEARFVAAREAFEERMLERIRNFRPKTSSKRKSASRVLGRPFRTVPASNINSGL